MAADIIVYGEELDENEALQVESIKNHPAFKNEKIRIMADHHAGAGCVIGFTSTYSDGIIPNLIGVDIGCGVLATRLYIGEDEIVRHNGSMAEMDETIRELVPLGFNRHEDLKVFKQIDFGRKDYGREIEDKIDELKDIASKYNVPKLIKAAQNIGDPRPQLGTLGGGKMIASSPRE